MSKLGLTDLIKAAEREVALRRAVFPKRVAAGAMKQHAADHEIAAMEQIVAILKWLGRDEELVKDLLRIAKLNPEAIALLREFPEAEMAVKEI